MAYCLNLPGERGGWSRKPACVYPQHKGSCHRRSIHTLTSSFMAFWDRTKKTEAYNLSPNRTVMPQTSFTVSKRGEKQKSCISQKPSHLFSEQKSWGIHCPFRAFQKYSKAALSQQKQNFKIYFISMNFQLGGTRSNWFLCRQKQPLWNFLSWSYYTSITDSIFCPRVGGYMGSCL